VLLFFVFSVQAGALDDARKKVDSDELYADPVWLQLLHYSGELFKSTPTSEEDGSAFYLHPHGKINPKSELLALLNAMYARDISAVCRFPARAWWLRRQLQDVVKLPSYHHCDPLVEWLNEFDGLSLSVGYAEPDISMPVSSFGHTFLILKDPNSTNLESGRVINYLADLNDAPENALLFNLNGLNGAFRGHVEVSSFYEVIRWYTRHEQRSVTEYRLDVPEDRVWFLLLAFWEMQNANFNYYFLDENCTYFIVKMLRLIEPSFSFEQNAVQPVTPISLINAIYASGMIRQAYYWPSEWHKIYELQDNVKQTMLEAIKDLVQGDLFFKQWRTSLPTEVDARTRSLLLAYRYLHYRAKQVDIPQERQALLSEQINNELILMGRGLVQEVTRKTISVDYSDPPLPAGRVALGLSASSQHPEAMMLDYRISLHDKSDPDISAFSPLELRTIDLRVGVNELGHSYLEHLAFFDLRSLKPWSSLAPYTSTHMSVGISRHPIHQNLDYAVSWGKGLSGQFGRGMAYAFIDGELGYATYFDESLYVALKPLLGMRYRINNELNGALEWELTEYLNHSTSADIAIRSVTSWQLERNNAIRLELEFHRLEENSEGRGTISWNHYF